MTSPTPDEIKAARKAAGLTQDQAAYELGVSRNTWHQWEHGKRPMRRAYFDLFAIYADREDAFKKDDG